jgi:hypothetical protein
MGDNSRHKNYNFNDINKNILGKMPSTKYLKGILSYKKNLSVKIFAPSHSIFSVISSMAANVL